MKKEDNSTEAKVKEKGVSIVVRSTQLGVDLYDMLDLFSRVLEGMGYILPDAVKYHLDFVDCDGQAESENEEPAARKKETK